MVLGLIYLNYFLVVAINVTAKRLKQVHLVVKASRWSWGSVFPSYIVMVSMQDPAGKEAF